jgi:hypothetical protein
VGSPGAVGLNLPGALLPGALPPSLVTTSYPAGTVLAPLGTAGPITGPITGSSAVTVVSPVVTTQGAGAGAITQAVTQGSGSQPQGPAITGKFDPNEIQSPMPVGSSGSASPAHNSKSGLIANSSSNLSLLINDMGSTLSFVMTHLIL